MELIVLDELKYSLFDKFLASDLLIQDFAGKGCQGSMVHFGIHDLLGGAR